ncbi:MAG: hypothetical protein KKA64_03625 [Nanoarchaeota archaeon]|nr:hypothetical protein [Nanoarchaeota archaeon]
MAKEKKSCLAELKKEYEILQKKHNLPSFKELNEEFSVEKVTEVETDYLLREMRRYIADKISNYMRLVETMLNPVNAPMSVFSMIKTLGTSDKKLLLEAYKKMVEIEIKLMKIDIEYSEKGEAEFIKFVFDSWQEIKKKIIDVAGTIEKNIDNKFENSNKGYFG